MTCIYRIHWHNTPEKLDSLRGLTCNRSHHICHFPDDPAGPHRQSRSIGALRTLGRSSLRTLTTSSPRRRKLHRLRVSLPSRPARAWQVHCLRGGCFGFRRHGRVRETRRHVRWRSSCLDAREHQGTISSSDPWRSSVEGLVLTPLCRPPAAGGDRSEAWRVAA